MSEFSIIILPKHLQDVTLLTVSSLMTMLRICASTLYLDQNRFGFSDVNFQIVLGSPIFDFRL